MHICSDEIAAFWMLFSSIGFLLPWIRGKFAQRSTSKHRHDHDCKH